MSIHRPTRRRVLAGGGAALGAGLAGCTGLLSSGGRGHQRAATVFHAGSLAPAFAALEEAFESRTDIGVRRESSGSIVATKKITEQGRAADAIGVADFRLLRNRLLPDFGDWYAVFATNAMAIQHREDAPGADRIGTDNWWEVLAREDAAVGHADPAADPGGYRAVMTLQLGAEPFEGDRLYDETTARSLRENAVVTTGSEIHLESQLRAGKLDYAITYRSLCETSDLPHVSLQPRVDLSRLTDRFAAHYATATVETSAGRFTGAPIAYAAAVPSVARSPGAGARWIESLVGESGRRHLDAAGLDPVGPVVPARAESAVPDRITDEARAVEALGPLSL